MARAPVDTKTTASRARRYAIRELESRGANDVQEARAKNRRVLLATNGFNERLMLIVKGRTSGSWQGTTADGDVARADDSTYWLFVDLEDGRSPSFCVVPDKWMRNDIAEAHAEYLAAHGGQRAVAPDSTHHAIKMDRLTEWFARWDLLRL